MHGVAVMHSTPRTSSDVEVGFPQSSQQQQTDVHALSSQSLGSDPFNLGLYIEESSRIAKNAGRGRKPGRKKVATKGRIAVNNTGKREARWNFEVDGMALPRIKRMIVTVSNNDLSAEVEFAQPRRAQ